jgi:hypothetical protein
MISLLKALGLHNAEAERPQLPPLRSERREPHPPLKPNHVVQPFRENHRCKCQKRCPPEGPERRCYATFLMDWSTDYLGGIRHPITGHHYHTYCVNCKKSAHKCEQGSSVVIQIDRCRDCAGQFPLRGVRWKEWNDEHWIDLDDW